jgi:hypothetical protein
VRLYTNIPLPRFTAPRASGYRRCPACDVVVAETNRHCDKCAACTTKHGRAPYVHCDACGRCVKPGFQHCAGCMRCAAPGHACDRGPATPSKATATASPREASLRGACHVCGSLEHRRKECPQRAKAKRHKAAL